MASEREPSEKYVAKRQVYAHALFHGSVAEVATARDELDDYVAKLEARLAAYGRMLPLCADHRDKQYRQPCLACEIERLRAMPPTAEEQEALRAVAPGLGPCRDGHCITNTSGRAFAVVQRYLHRLDGLNASRTVRGDDGE